MASAQSSAGGDTPRPLDLVHLSRRTAGDRSLEREVLALFGRQCVLYLDRLHRARDLALRRDLAHALAGSARAVGAFEVAAAATALEQDATADCGTLDREVAEASAFVAALLDEPDRAGAAAERACGTAAREATRPRLVNGAAHR